MQSSSQIITTNKPTSSLFTGRMPFLSPNQQCQSTEGKISLYMDLLTPRSSSGGLPTLSLTTNSSWLPWGGLPCLSSALWCQNPVDVIDWRTQVRTRNQKHHLEGRGKSLPSGNFQLLGGHVATPMHQLALNFVRQSGPTCPSATPSFTSISVHNESPLWGENAEFWPLNNIGSLPLCGNPAGNIST